MGPICSASHTDDPQEDAAHLWRSGPFASNSSKLVSASTCCCSAFSSNRIAAASPGSASAALCCGLRDHTASTGSNHRSAKMEHAAGISITTPPVTSAHLNASHCPPTHHRPPPASTALRVEYQTRAPAAQGVHLQQLAIPSAV